MSFQNAQQARIWIAHLALAAYTRNASSDASTDMIDVTTLADTARAFIPGQDTSTFQIDGPLDTDATSNGQADTIADWKANTSPTPITYMPLGVSSTMIWLIEGLVTDLSMSSAVAGSSDWACSAQTNGQTDFAGVVLSNTAITSDTNGSSLDNGAGTSNGAVCHLHVSAFSGFTSDAITVEHSTNNSVWATLATFTTVSGVTSQRLAVTGTVNRYLRVVDDVTGTGSITRLVAVARR